MKKKILSLFLLFSIACEVNIGEGDDNDQNKVEEDVKYVYD